MYYENLEGQQESADPAPETHESPKTHETEQEQRALTDVTVLAREDNAAPASPLNSPFAEDTLLHSPARSASGKAEGSISDLSDADVLAAGVLALQPALTGHFKRALAVVTPDSDKAPPEPSGKKQKGVTHQNNSTPAPNDSLNSGLELPTSSATSLHENRPMFRAECEGGLLEPDQGTVHNVLMETIDAVYEQSDDESQAKKRRTK